MIFKFSKITKIFMNQCKIMNFHENLFTITDLKYDFINTQDH